MEGGILCAGFEMTYPKMNLNMFKNSIKEYEYLKILVLCCETEEGFKVSKICKPTKKGTKVKFVNIENKEDALKYTEFIKTKVKEFNEKYNEKLVVE